MSRNLFAQSFDITKGKTRNVFPIHYTIAIDKKKFPDSTTIEGIKKYFDSLPQKPITTVAKWYSAEDTTLLLFYALIVKDSSRNVSLGDITKFNKFQCAKYKNEIPLLDSKQLPKSRTIFLSIGTMNVEYYDNGLISTMKFYDKNKLPRYKWKYYDDKGNLIKMEIYSNGILKKTKEYNHHIFRKQKTKC